MSWKDLVSLCVVIVGVILFLYGANNYNRLVGWAGIYLVISGFLVRIILMVWEALKKKGED